MALFLHNTLTRARERVRAGQPADPKRVTMYVCGPTVYNYAHIGNARPPVVFDVLQRLLRRSYTLVLRAQRHRRRRQDQRRREAEACRSACSPPATSRPIHEDMRTLGVAPPDVEPRATEHMPQIIAHDRAADRGGPRVRGRGPRAVLRAELRRLRPALGPRPRRHARRRARRGRAVQARPRRLRAVEAVGRPTSPAGRARGAAAARAGTSSARRWPRRISARRSTSTAAASTCCSRTTRTSSRRAPARTAASASRATGCTTASCSSDGEKMSKSLGNVRLVRDLLGRARRRDRALALLTAHYRQPLDWTDAARRRVAAQARPHVRRAARRRHRAAR